jgi:pyruvate/2-oxoglutarate/acetoin dehydrogenase E1 component
VAEVKRKGDDITIVAVGDLVLKALAAGDKLAERGIDAEVIDPRTLRPLDTRTILDSVRKTGRLVIAHNAAKTGGIGAEIAAIVAEEGFGHLKAPIVRVANPDSPIAFSPPLQKFILPGEEDVLRAVENLMTNS